MNNQPEQNYQKLLTEIIQKHIAVLGPYFTFMLVKNTNGITVSENGEVTAITGNPQEITQKLIEQLTNLSEQLAKKNLQPILSKHLSPQMPLPNHLPQSENPDQTLDIRD